MNLIKTVDGIHIVNDMAEGLLARIYLAKGKLLLPEFSALLNDPEMLKIRFKLEKKYPILPDFQKV